MFRCAGTGSENLIERYPNRIKVARFARDVIVKNRPRKIYARQLHCQFLSKKLYISIKAAAL